MWYKYCLSFKYQHSMHTTYIRAKSFKHATERLFKIHKANTITLIEQLGEPLPSASGVASVQIKQKKLDIARRKKLKGAIKYLEKAGKLPY